MALPAPIAPKVNQAAIAVANGSNRVSQHLGQTTTPGALIGGAINIGESRQAVLIVKAGETAYIPQAGLSYYFEFIGTTAGVSNALGLTVRAMQKGQPRSNVIHVQGTGLRFGTATFSAIQVFNPNASDVLFTIDIGGGIANNSYDEFLDNRVILSSGGSAVTVFDKQAVTVAVGFTTRVGAWADSLGAGATQDITDGYLTQQRKAIIIGNDDNVAVLTVFDAAGNILGSIQPGTSFYLETGGDVKLHNPTGNAVVCHIGEVYYT